MRSQVPHPHESGLGGPLSAAFPSLELLAAAGSAAEGVGTSGGGEACSLHFHALS